MEIVSAAFDMDTACVNVPMDNRQSSTVWPSSWKPKTKWNGCVRWTLARYRQRRDHPKFCVKAASSPASPPLTSGSVGVMVEKRRHRSDRCRLIPVSAVYTCGERLHKIRDRPTSICQQVIFLAYVPIFQSFFLSFFCFFRISCKFN